MTRTRTACDIEQGNNGKRIIPTIVFEDSSILVEPSNAELAQKLGLRTKAKREFYDVIVLGGWPRRSQFGYLYGKGGLGHPDDRA